MDPRNEMTAVMRFTVDAAMEMLSKRSEFDPFAGTLDSDGSMSLVLHKLTEPLAGQDALEALYSLLRHRTRERACKAVAIASNVTVRDSESGDLLDCVRIEVEHVQDIPITSLFPYSLENGFQQTLDPWMEPGDRHVFEENPGA